MSNKLSPTAKNTLNARVINLAGTRDDWGPHDNHILEAGEIAVYLPDASREYSTFKIGDGRTLLKQLDFFEPDSTRSWQGIDAGNISKYPKQKFTITIEYDDNGSAPTVTEVDALTTISKPEDPEKDGYTFIGWYIDDIEYDFNQKVTADLTLIAKWEPITAE